MHEALARIAEQIEGTRVPTARGANAYRPADVDAGCDAMADRLRSAGPVDREELSGHARDARFGTTGFGRGYACEDAYEVADIEAVVTEVRTALAGGGEEADRCVPALAALTAARPRQAAPGTGGWDRERVDAALIAVAEQLRSGAERAG